MNRSIGLTILLLIGNAWPCLAWAEQSEKIGTLSFVLENDVFYGNDRHYTNGVRLVWIPGGDAPTPEWATQIARRVPWFPEHGQILHGYAFGQSMFAPNDITVAKPSLKERPYAGWLYGAIGMGVESGRQLDLLALSIGVVGPLSMAEESQKFIHKVIDSDDPKGWGSQLDNEPGVVMTYQRSWRKIATTTAFGNELDLTPHAGITLGNVFTYANAGATLRYGHNLPRDYGPPRIQPGLPGAGDFSPVAKFGWYLFAGVEGRVVAHNIFLDGNTFGDSRSVDKRPLVGDLQFGFDLDWSDVRLSYTHVIRSREFQGQEDNDTFGAVSISFRFY